ncbi:MAG: hypothetical protein QM627_05185 [Luteolibacter sp.]
MNPQPPKNGSSASGNPLPEANVLREQDKTKIWNSLRNQQIRHGPHPDDYRAVKIRLEREWYRIILTVNWVILKLGAPVAEFTDADAHEFFKSAAAGESFVRRRRIWKMLKEHRGAVSGWVAAVVIAVVASKALSRPVEAPAPIVVPAPAPVVIERFRIPSTIYIKKTGDQYEAWEGTTGDSEPSSGKGRWVRTRFQNPQ